MILIFYFLFRCCYVFANTFPQINAGDVDAEIVLSKFYDGSSLYGYIDGAAEVYLEYGFDKLLVQELNWKKHKIVINIYCMKDSEAAFGIYSISTYKCQQCDSLPDFTCITPYQVQYLKGKYYISIINEKASAEEQDYCILLMDIFKQKIENNDFSIPHLFTNKLFAPDINKLKYFRGHLGVQNGYPDWLDLFEEIKSYKLYLLPFSDKKEYTNIALISFPGREELNQFLDKVKINFPFESRVSKKQQDGKFRLVSKKNKNTIIYLESNRNENELTEIISIINSEPL